MFCEMSVKTGPIYIRNQRASKYQRSKGHNKNLFPYSKNVTYTLKWSQVHIMINIKTSVTQIKSCKTSHILLLSSHILGQVDIIKFNCLL